MSTITSPRRADRTTRTRHRPALVTATIGVLAFLGVTALAGGIALAAGWGAPPASWLDAIPLISGWVVPGLVLAGGFGVGSLVTAAGMGGAWRRARARGLRRSLGYHWSWLATLLLGAGQALWIGLEFAYLPAVSVLQFVYAAVAAALIVLPLTVPVRGYLTIR